MARYIDADALAKVLFDIWQECDDIKILIPAIRNVIKCEGIVDCVTVVRCKNCEHWDEEFEECDCPKMGRRVQVPAGFYCGWGERKEITGKAGEKEKTEYEE